MKIEPVCVCAACAKQRVITDRLAFIKGLETAKRYAYGVGDVDTVRLLKERISKEKKKANKQ